MRRFIVALAGLLCALAAQAQTPPLDEHQTLACLVKSGTARVPTDATRPPTAHDPPALVRLRLLFDRADQPPAVEVLASTATAETRDAVLAHVAGYRLPCLEARPVAAVQEFQFAPDLMPLGGALLVVPGPATADRSCIVKPTQFFYAPEPRVVDRVVMALTFNGDGNSPPAVTLLGSNGDDVFKRVMLRVGKAWRQPCRKASDWPLREETSLQVSMAGTHPARFKKPRVPLSEFLGYTKDANDARVFFDFDTMQCPFTLRWTLHEPWARNRVREVEGDNPNRVALIEWLQGLHSGLQPDMMNRLIGESLQIDVPCGQLNLSPKRAAE